jgi:1,4-alpha-glucan branching enzyme
VAEESTAWGGVTRPASANGLGFTFKWNMGWMHDTLEYFKRDPIYRTWHHDELTFAMIYEYTERFVMPLSHDEVVHGKASLLEKMPGDPWRKFANLRLLLAYQCTRPGKQLLFMGTELAPHEEWSHERSLPWHLADDPPRRGLSRFLEDLGRLYRESPALWRRDHEPGGFSWIEGGDRENCVLSYLRWDDEGHHLVVLANLTPTPLEHYRIGVPRAGRYVERFSSDRAEYWGSGFQTLNDVETEPTPFHGHPQSIGLRVPPLGLVVLAPAHGS